MPNGDERPIELGVPPPAPQRCDTEFTTTATGTAQSAEIIDPPRPPGFPGSARVVAQQKITVRWKCVT